MVYPPGNLSIPGPAGALECILREAPGTGLWAVVSHPHPLYGGTMHNKVVYRTALALEESGYQTIRYNFRGVGGSAGVHDEGRGEADDLRAVLDHVTGARGGREVLLAGFSFGAWIGARVGAADPRVRSLLHVGVVTKLFERLPQEAFRKPCAAVQGESDEHGEPSRVEEILRPGPSARLLVVAGADHFFKGKIPELDAALRGAIHFLTAGLTAGLRTGPGAGLTAASEEPPREGARETDPPRT